MPVKSNTVKISVSDASAFIVTHIRMGYAGEYGYDVYIPKIMNEYLLSVHKIEYSQRQQYYQSISPSFYSASWNLSLRGILRPGISHWGEQATDQGNAGNGYSITPFGEKWLKEADKSDFISTEPGRFAKMLSKFNSRFGHGFASRAQETIRCYVAHAYLACCVMCGAAAESIILAWAIDRFGDKEKIENDYMAKGGRGRLEQRILSQLKRHVESEIKTHNSILKYWRDISGHGKESNISEEEAYIALVGLLRLAQVINDNWDSYKGTEKNIN